MFCFIMNSSLIFSYHVQYIFQDFSVEFIFQKLLIQMKPNWIERVFGWPILKIVSNSPLLHPRWAPKTRHFSFQVKMSSNVSLNWMRMSSAKALFFGDYNFRGFWFSDIYVGIFLVFFNHIINSFGTVFHGEHCQNISKNRKTNI